MTRLRVEATIVDGADLELLQRTLSEMRTIGLLSDVFLEVPLIEGTFNPDVATRVAMITADRGYVESQDLAQFVGKTAGLRLSRIDDVTPPTNIAQLFNRS